MLANRGLDSQIISQLVECRAETTRGLELFEPKHRIVTLLDRFMILLYPVVQVLIVPMQDFTSGDPTNCLRVGRVFVGCHSKWLLPYTVD